jgi:hypothetical protein
MAANLKTPVKKEVGAVEAQRSSDAEVDAFLARVNTITPSSGRGASARASLDRWESRFFSSRKGASQGPRAPSSSILTPVAWKAAVSRVYLPAEPCPH